MANNSPQADHLNMFGGPFVFASPFPERSQQRQFCRLYRKRAVIFRCKRPAWRRRAQDTGADDFVKAAHRVKY